jgi:hypothetical protein
MSYRNVMTQRLLLQCLRLCISVSSNAIMLRYVSTYERQKHLLNTKLCENTGSLGGE